MYYNDEFDEGNKNRTFAIAAFIAIAAIVCVVVFVLLANSSKLKRKLSDSDAVSKASVIKEAFTILDSSEDVESVLDKSTGLTVADLDFYDMYPKEESYDNNETVEPLQESENKEENDYATDGKHTLLTYADGTSEWVAISPNLTKNSYDYTNLINSSGKMKYFEDNRCISAFGVDISKEQDYVDFNKVKKAGVDFVMLRVGTRGYQSGQINPDDYFEQNIKRAKDAGLEVGVYFISNAISEEEAVEEAMFVINSLGTYTLTYPIGYMMSYAKNDTSRIDDLSKGDKTKVARAFLNTIVAAGYKPVVYGTKEWLINEVELAKLIGDYDFWITSEDKDLPDYPYKFSMWQYASDGSIDGISGTVNLNISFIDYSLK